MNTLSEYEWFTSLFQYQGKPVEVVWFREWSVRAQVLDPSTEKNPHESIGLLRQPHTKSSQAHLWKSRFCLASARVRGVAPMSRTAY